MTENYRNLISKSSKMGRVSQFQKKMTKFSEKKRTWSRWKNARKARGMKKLLIVGWEMLMMLLHQGICFYYSLLCFNPFLCIIVYFANQFGEFLQSVVRGELRAHFLKLLVLTKYVTPINFPSIINQLSTDMLSIFHKYYEYLTVCRTFLLRGKDLTQHS